jgi:acetylglutamate kinase
MGRLTALVKVSGDLCQREDVIEWIRKLSAEYFTVILVGGGTQINAAFEEAGFKVAKHGPLGRETEIFKESQLARDVLEENQEIVQDLLALRGVMATVVIPVLDIGSVLCHINGDIYILTAYLGFDKIFVLTYQDRVREKKRAFKKYPKIEVIGFPGE